VLGLACLASLGLLKEAGRERAPAPRRALPPTEGAAASLAVLYGAGPEPETAPAQEPDVPEWEVIVLGADHRPVTNLDLLTLNPMGEWDFQDTTDAAGRARVPAPSEGSCHVSLGGGWQATATLTRDRTVLACDEFVPLEITVVDAADGHRLDFAPAVRSHARRMGLVGLEECPDPPEGYVGQDLVWQERVSRFAERAFLIVPVWPEIRVRARVVTDQGKPIPEAWVDRVGGWGLCSKTDADGYAYVPKVPHIPGNRLTVRAESADGVSRATVVLDASRLDYDVVLTATPHSRRSGRGGHRNLRACCGRRERTGTATLGVTVLRCNGLPAAGAAVVLAGPVSRSEPVDVGGEARFEGLPAGRYRARVAEPGFVLAAQDVEVEDGGHVEVSLREPEGWTVEVLVVTPEGAPAPFATISVKQEEAPYALLRDGVQVLDPRTDVAGRIELPHLADEPAEIHAALGSLRGSVTIAPGGGPAVLRLSAD